MTARHNTAMMMTGMRMCCAMHMKQAPVVRMTDFRG